MIERSMSEIRDEWSETVRCVADRGERVVVVRSGRRVAGIVSAEDLALLELLEDRADLEIMRKTKAESVERIPLAQVRAELGIQK